MTVMTGKVLITHVTALLVTCVFGYNNMNPTDEPTPNYSGYGERSSTNQNSRDRYGAPGFWTGGTAIGESGTGQGGNAFGGSGGVQGGTGIGGDGYNSPNQFGQGGSGYGGNGGSIGGVGIGGNGESYGGHGYGGSGTVQGGTGIGGNGKFYGGDGIGGNGGSTGGTGIGGNGGSRGGTGIGGSGTNVRKEDTNTQYKAIQHHVLQSTLDHISSLKKSVCKLSSIFLPTTSLVFQKECEQTQSTRTQVTNHFGTAGFQQPTPASNPHKTSGGRGGIGIGGAGGIRGGIGIGGSGSGTIGESAVGGHGYGGRGGVENGAGFGGDAHIYNENGEIVYTRHGTHETGQPHRGGVGTGGIIGNKYAWSS